MKDKNFIASILQKGNEARNKVEAEFTNISLEQLNWKPSPEKWSIGQCLEHLIISDSCYFPDLEKITTGTYNMSHWEKYSPFTSLCGRILKDQLQEQVKRKMTAPKIIRPSSSELKLEIMEQYFNNLDRFLNYISKCSDIDIDDTIINSPTISIVTYSLRDAFYFLVAHEHRHINQAIRIKHNDEFPAK